MTLACDWAILRETSRYRQGWHRYDTNNDTNPRHHSGQSLSVWQTRLIRKVSSAVS